MGDHLGSTSLVVNTSGAQVARRSYLPFGAQWAASGSLPTDFGFTGQREADEIGLYYYVARWLDPEIAHFAQADTIVPGAGNPAAYNRYGYVMYNPLKYTDPSGHGICDGEHPQGDFCLDKDNTVEIPDWKNWTYENWSTPLEGLSEEEWRHVRAGMVWTWLCQRPEGCPTAMEVMTYLLYAEAYEMWPDSKAIDIVSRSIVYKFRNGISIHALSSYTSFINPIHKGSSLGSFDALDWQRLIIDLDEIFTPNSTTPFINNINQTLELGPIQDSMYYNEVGQPIVYFWISYSDGVISHAPFEGNPVGWYNAELYSNGIHYKTISFGGQIEACKAGFIHSCP
jgi:RHS repeat-associated protein